MRNTKTKSLALALATLILVGGGATAFAFWSGAGSGASTASISAGTSAAVVINQTSVLTPMAPGIAGQTLSGNFNNNATGATAVQVASVTATVANVSKGGSTITSCTAADFVITGGTMAVNQNIPVGAAQGSWTGASIAFNNTSGNQDACKGATVNISYVAQ